MNKLFYALALSVALSALLCPVLGAKRKCYECDASKCEEEFNKTNTDKFENKECSKEDSMCYKFEYEDGSTTKVSY